MALNTIIIDFEPCNPTPAEGYVVKYRPLGSSDPYRIWPVNFFGSPAIIEDHNDPVGTSYEGAIYGDCGGGIFGVEVPWEAPNEEQPPDESGMESQPPDESEPPPIEGNPIEVGLGFDEPTACADSSVVYLIPPDTVIDVGDTVYSDSACTIPIVETILRDFGGVLYNVASGVVISPTGNAC